MNKTEFIEKVAEKAAVSKKDAGTFVDAVFDSIEEALVSGDSVKFVGFGSLEVRERAARQGRNPQDPDKVVMIPASKAPVFKAGKALKDAVNK